MEAAAETAKIAAVDFVELPADCFDCIGAFLGLRDLGQFRRVARATREIHGRHWVARRTPLEISREICGAPAGLLQWVLAAGGRIRLDNTATPALWHAEVRELLARGAPNPHRDDLMPAGAFWTSDSTLELCVREDSAAGYAFVVERCPLRSKDLIFLALKWQRPQVLAETLKCHAVSAVYGHRLITGAISSSACYDVVAERFPLPADRSPLVLDAFRSLNAPALAWLNCTHASIRKMFPPRKRFRKHGRTQKVDKVPSVVFSEMIYHMATMSFIDTYDAETADTFRRQWMQPIIAGLPASQQSKVFTAVAGRLNSRCHTLQTKPVLWIVQSWPGFAAEHPAFLKLWVLTGRWQHGELLPPEATKPARLCALNWFASAFAGASPARRRKLRRYILACRFPLFPDAWDLFDQSVGGPLLVDVQCGAVYMRDNTTLDEYAAAYARMRARALDRGEPVLTREIECLRKSFQTRHVVTSVCEVILATVPEHQRMLLDPGVLSRLLRLSFHRFHQNRLGDIVAKQLAVALAGADAAFLARMRRLSVNGSTSFLYMVLKASASSGTQPAPWLVAACQDCDTLGILSVARNISADQVNRWAVFAELLAPAGLVTTAIVSAAVAGLAKKPQSIQASDENTLALACRLCPRALISACNTEPLLAAMLILREEAFAECLWDEIAPARLIDACRDLTQCFCRPITRPVAENLVARGADLADFVEWFDEAAAAYAEDRGHHISGRVFDELCSQSSVSGASSSAGGGLPVDIFGSAKILAASLAQDYTRTTRATRAARLIRRHNIRHEEARASFHYRCLLLEFSKDYLARASAVELSDDGYAAD